MLALHIYEKQLGAAFGLDMRRIEKALCAMLLCLLKERQGEVQKKDAQENDCLSLTFVRDAEIQRINAAQRGLDCPTNVLSFPLYLPDEQGLALPAGDLLISVDTLQREAFMYGQDIESYVLTLLAHGLAHLVGLEHGEEMENLEHILLQSC